MKKVTIDPITRLEGHGKIEIFLDEKSPFFEPFVKPPVPPEGGPEPAR
jgi:F420-non-reducing hydrogenase large subunit